MTTRSACLPAAIEPTRAARPRIRGAVQRADADRLERREARLDEQLELPLVRVPGNDSAAAGRIGAGDEHAAGARERALERQRLGKQRRVDRLLVLRRALVVLLELLFQLRQQHVEAGRHRTARREGLEHRQRGRQRDLLDRRASSPAP